MSDIVLVDGVRTPHGSLLGSLADVSAVELGRTAVDGLLDRVGVEPNAIEWVSLGNAIQAGIGQVPGRQVVVESTLPAGTPATTINEASGSGLRAIALAVDRIEAGRAGLVVAGGFESMTNAPWILPDYRKGRRHGDVTAKDSMILDALWDVTLDVHMGEITERLVERFDGEPVPEIDIERGQQAPETFDLSRTVQDEYALGSHRRAARAIEDGVYDEEIVPVETSAGSIDRDEGPRPESTVADLAELSPSFRSAGTITPANASKLADGAGVVLLADRDTAADHGLDPTATLVDYAVAYRPPDEFNEAVGDALESLLSRTDTAVEDVDTFVVNEAFAAQSVHVRQQFGIDRDRFNPDGGAVAFGHPIGASGGMLATSLAHEMDAADHQYGVVGMSIGGGGAILSLWERE